MAINFINDHQKAGVDVAQDGNLIAWIRYTRTEGYIVDFEDDTSLDVAEMKEILNKMEELTLELPAKK